MKKISLTLLLALPLALFAADVKPGDSANDVRAALGAPRGQVDVGGHAIFYYDRGEIELRSGVVTRVSLRSAADQVALENRRAAEASRVRDEQDIRRAQLSAEGTALKARKLSDPAFQAAPLDYQVAFWEDFSRRYAEVPCSEQLTVARARLAEKVADGQVRTEQARRLAELEARVALAEAQASNAREQAAFYPPFTSSYRQFRDYYHDHYRYPATPVQLPSYQFYEHPMPYATSPGMPPRIATIRKEPASGVANDSVDYSHFKPSGLSQNFNDEQQDLRWNGSSGRRF